ncbi:hypothetical protein CBL_00689 [Carabus blaptoides fortunei]
MVNSIANNFVAVKCKESSGKFMKLVEHETRARIVHANYAKTKATTKSSGQQWRQWRRQHVHCGELLGRRDETKRANTTKLGVHIDFLARGSAQPQALDKPDLNHMSPMLQC